MNITMETTRDELIQELEAITGDFKALSLDRDRECRIAARKIKLLETNKENLFAEAKVLIEDLRKARQHRDRLLDERNELSDRLFRSTS